MVELNHFVHYFEVFVGFNAAIAGFDDTRNMTYSFFRWSIDRRFDYETKRINAGLQKIRVCLLINNARPVSKNPPWSADVFNEHYIDFYSRYRDCKEQLEKAINDTNDYEMNYVEKRVPPWLVFCLLYCVMLILLCGYSETVPAVKHNCYIFLSFFNFFVWGAFFVNLLYNSFLRKHISKILYKLKIKAWKRRQPNIEHKYYYIYRHISRFFLVTLISVCLTYLNYKLTNAYPDYILMSVPISLVLISTLIICFMPLLLLIICGYQWKIRHIKPIIKDLKKECDSLNPVVYAGLRWIRKSKVIYRFR